MTMPPPPTPRTSSSPISNPHEQEEVPAAMLDQVRLLHLAVTYDPVTDTFHVSPTGELGFIDGQGNFQPGTPPVSPVSNPFTIPEEDPDTISCASALFERITAYVVQQN